MAANIGPNIVDDGLVLHLDAANIKSFRGEPTTNLALDCPVAESTIKLMTSESNYRPINSNAHASVVQVYDVDPPVKDMTVWKMYNSNPDNYSRFGIGQSGSSKIRIDDFGDYNVTYIASIYVYLPYGVTYGTANNCWAYQNSTGTDWHGGTYIDTPHPDYGYYGSSITDTYTSADKDITNEWQRLSVTFTTSSTIKDYGGENNCPYITIQFRPSLVGTDGNSFLYISSLQIEERSYITPFICGTRGTTVVTGGGLIDLSQNENHGELVNGPIFDSSNLGSLEFDDGASQYVDTDLIPTFVHNDATHIAWIKYSAFGDATGCHNSRRFYMGLSSSTIFGWGVCNQNNWGSGATHSIGLNEWVMLAVVADNGTARGYLNGQDTEITFNYTKESQYSPNQSYKLGSWNGIDNFIDGNIANTIIYNKALSANEILQIYNAQKGRFGL